MRCGECPAAIWYAWTDCAEQLPHYVGIGRPCPRTVMDLRREATRLRCIADALDRAAEMREREEAVM